MIDEADKLSGFKLADKWLKWSKVKGKYIIVKRT